MRKWAKVTAKAGITLVDYKLELVKAMAKFF
jgi:phosphoribosylaminoimidazole-succinocarboxamide synthase